MTDARIDAVHRLSLAAYGGSSRESFGGRQWDVPFRPGDARVLLGLLTHLPELPYLEVRACVFAHAAHLGQRRRYIDEPYIEHPRRVAEMARAAGCSAPALAAAWLHDVMEDCGVSSDAIAEQFGRQVAEMVADLTKCDDPALPRRQRKQLDRERLAKACDDSQTVKLADILDNAPSIIGSDPDFARVYVCEIDALLDDMRGGSAALRSRALEMIAAYQQGRVESWLESRSTGG